MKGHKGAEHHRSAAKHHENAAHHHLEAAKQHDSEITRKRRIMRIPRMAMRPMPPTTARRRPSTTPRSMGISQGLK
jgi:hypothetical protein